MLSSLSSVPPVWPRPRPEIIGTATSQAARIGASMTLTLSPTPPVECLSTTGLPRSQSSTSPESRIARVSATRSSLSRPRRKKAIASAPTWASLRVPSVIPPTRKAISSANSAAPSRFLRMTSEASIFPRESLDEPHEVARRHFRVAQRLLVRQLLAPHPLGEVGDRRDRDYAQPGVAGEDHLGNRRHPDRVRAKYAERADLRGGLEGRSGGGEVDAFGEVDLQLVCGAVQEFPELRVVGVAHAREARAERVVVGPGERVDAEQVDVVGDRHQPAGADVGVERSGRVGDE